MESFLRIVILTMLFSNPTILLSQDDPKREYSVQLNLGLSRTLHYNQPVNLIQCIEGCFPEEQTAKTTPNGNLNLYRDFDKKNSLKIGFGASSYKFEERGQSNIGDGVTFVPVESVRRWSFYGFSVGYRYIFNSEKKVRLFIENDFIYEIPTEDYPLFQSGLAIQPKIGAILGIDNNWSIIAEGFYKSALTVYSDKDFGKDYKPYAYGIQLGVNLKI